MFYGARKFMKSDNLKRDSKLLIYKSLIRAVFTYASYWTLSQADENALAIFERRILRSIFVGICVNTVWRRRTNSELYRIFKVPGILKYYKIQRMK